MNFKCALFVAVFLFAMAVYASPADFVDDLGVVGEQDAVEHHGLRLKRATCDLLSGFGVGDSACAAGCIGRGFRGGWCDSRKVCNCRR